MERLSGNLLKFCSVIVNIKLLFNRVSVTNNNTEPSFQVKRSLIIQRFKTVSSKINVQHMESNQETVDTDSSFIN